jgi:hypothetical protein
MNILGLGKSNKTLSELEEEEQIAEKEVSIAEKKAVLRKLKAAGLTPKSFANWREIVAWFKTH